MAEMDKVECRNCRWFELWHHNRKGYPRGHCNLHIARRIGDGFIVHLSITADAEYTCDSFDKKITEYCPTCGQLIEFKDANYHKSGAPDDRILHPRLDGDS